MKKFTVFAGAAGALAVLYAGYLIGVSAQAGWSLTSTALATIIALLMVVFAFAVRQDVQDGDPMPESQRRFLALYLVSISVGLVYLVFALMAVRFPDLEAVTPASAPTLPDSARPPKGAVAIAQVIPNPIRSDVGPIDLQIFGYNFTAPVAPAAGSGGSSDSTETPAAGEGAAGAGGRGGAGGTQPDPTGRGRAGGAGGSGTQPGGTGRGTATSGAPTVVFRSMKAPKVSSDQLLIVPLSHEDLSVPGVVPITVMGANGSTASTTVRVLDVTGELHLLRWTRQVTREMQLLLLVVAAGALGSYVHAIRSLTAYIGNQQAVASWFWFYITKPFLGVALAIVFYAAIRGGFVAGSPADAKSVNPFGVFAIAALVGMFADKAGNKLAEIFEALFRSNSERQNPISSLAVVTPSLPDAAATQAYTAKIVATGGTTPYSFGLIGAPAWLTIDAATGDLSGTPPAAKEEKFEVTVMDAKTSRTAKKYTLKVL
jgi:hypothetical protein